MGCPRWRIVPWQSDDPADRGMVLSVVPPCGVTTAHVHPECEYFLVVRGSGVVYVDDESVPVKDGDAIAVPSGARHHFENTSESEPLEIVGVWSTSDLGML